jgi:hypothetical protein
MPSSAQRCGGASAQVKPRRCRPHTAFPPCLDRSPRIHLLALECSQHRAMPLGVVGRLRAFREHRSMALQSLAAAEFAETMMRELGEMVYRAFPRSLTPLLAPISLCRVG